MASNPLPTRRVLVVDDNRAIHEDFVKILSGKAGASSELLAAERLLLGEALAATPRPTFQIDTALRSEEHTSELQSQSNLVCRLLLAKKKAEQHVPAFHTNACLDLT